MEIKIEVIEEKLKNDTSVLDDLLADEYVLSMRTRDAHRYVHGNNLIELQKLFKSQYDSMDAIVADVSRKIRVSRLLTPSVFANYLSNPALNMHNERFTKQNQIIEALVDDHESVIRHLRGSGSPAADERIDNGTVVFLKGLLERHEKMAGALKDWLQ